MIKKAINPDLYDTLILTHKDAVNKQGNIMLIT